MEYDVFLSYAFPILGIAIFLALLCVGLAMVIAKLRGQKEMPTWILVVLGFGFLSSIAVIFIVGTLFGWETPI